MPHASHDHLCHSCDAPRICALTPHVPATSDCVDVFGILVCLRKSRLSSVKALTSWPSGRKLKGGRATRNRCCKGIQLIHVHVFVDRRSATPGRRQLSRCLVFPDDSHKLQGRSACSNCRRTRSRHTIIQSHMVIEHNCRARCSNPQGHVQFAAQEVAFPTTTSRRQLVQEAAAVPSYCSCHVTQRTPINTNRVATTRRAWCCVANARSTKRDRAAASSQRASAKRPTICGPFLRLGLCMVAPFECVSRCHVHDGTDLVMGHKGFAKFTVGCHSLRRVATVNI